MRGFLALLTTLALAAPGVASAQAADPLAHVLAALSGDWNGDGNGDAVFLLQAPEGSGDIDLRLGDGVRGLQPHLALPGAVFAGPMAGQTPWLEPRSATSFAIVQEQTGVGRLPWTLTLTVAWRGGEFVVAGYTYAFYDRLDPTHQGSCDVNLLTGGFERVISPGEGAATRNETGTDTARGFPLAELTMDFTPGPCAELFN